MAKVYVTIEVEVPGTTYEGACAILDESNFSVISDDDKSLEVSVIDYQESLL